MVDEARPEQPSVPDKSANTWAMACHLSALAGFIGIPFGHIIGPIVFWMLKKEQFPVVDENGKEALNFQISVTIYGLVCALLVLVLIGIPLLIGHNHDRDLFGEREQGAAGPLSALHPLHQVNAAGSANAAAGLCCPAGGADGLPDSA